jgi:hypothetical protein
METTFYIILPNLRYKKKDDDIYFVSNAPIKLKKNGKFYYQTEFPLYLEKRKYTFYYNQNSYECCIKEEEEENGLNVSVKYKKNSQLNKDPIIHDSIRIKELAKLFEAYLLHIPSYLQKHEEENNIKIEKKCKKSQIYKSDDYYSNYNNNQSYYTKDSEKKYNEDYTEDYDENNVEDYGEDYGENDEECYREEYY